MTDATPTDGKALLARIKPKRREVTTHICLSHELIAEFHAEDAELTRMRAEAAKGNRNAGKGVSAAAIKKQAQKVRNLEDRIVDEQVEFRFRSLNPAEFRALRDDHPPRPDNQLDVVFGYNRDAVLDALVQASMLSPVFDDESWTELLDVINPAEWEHLRDTVNDANSGVVDAPKSPQASLILDRRATTSE